MLKQVFKNTFKSLLNTKLIIGIIVFAIMLIPYSFMIYKNNIWAIVWLFGSAVICIPFLVVFICEYDELKANSIKEGVVEK